MDKRKSGMDGQCLKAQWQQIGPEGSPGRGSRFPLAQIPVRTPFQIVVQTLTPTLDHTLVRTLVQTPVRDRPDPRSGGLEVWDLRSDGLEVERIATQVHTHGTSF